MGLCQSLHQTTLLKTLKFKHMDLPQQTRLNDGSEPINVYHEIEICDEISFNRVCVSGEYVLLLEFPDQQCCLLIRQNGGNFIIQRQDTKLTVTVAWPSMSEFSWIYYRLERYQKNHNHPLLKSVLDQCSKWNKCDIIKGELDNYNKRITVANVLSSDTTKEVDTERARQRRKLKNKKHHQILEYDNMYTAEIAERHD